MDHKDEFSKWMATVETALRSESTPVLDENIPAVNECGCGSWNCPSCFPQQGADPLSVLNGMPDADSAPCPTCGHSEQPMQVADACPSCGHAYSDEVGSIPFSADPTPHGMSVLEVAGGEVDPESVQALTAKLSSGEITYEDFKRELESLEHTDYSMRQGEMGMIDGDTPAGHRAWDRDQDDWTDMDDEFIEYDELEEEPMDMVQKPSFEKGSKGGVKLGSIIQKFVPADSEGKDSPLTNGNANLGEMRDEDDETGYQNRSYHDWDAESEARPYDGYLLYRAKGGTLPRHQWEFDQAQGLEEAPVDDFDGPEELEMGSPLSKLDFDGAMEQMDPDEAMEMISEIKYMQDRGLSMASRDFSEDEMAAMKPSQLKKTLNMVRGTVSEEDEMMQDAGMDAATGGTLGATAAGGGGGGHYAPGTAPTMPESIQQKGITMENIDKDIAAMLTSLKKYDKLNESVLGMTTTKMVRPVVEETKKKPDFLDFDKDEDKKEPMTKALKDKEKKEEVKEGADADVLDWMSRFSKLGNMKGYGR